MGSPRIIVGFHSNGLCPVTFAVDLARAMRYSGTVVPLALCEQSCYVDSSRNKLVKQFLALPPVEATHLMMIDVDISFPMDAFLKTFSLLQAVGADVLYANYPLGNSGNSLFGPAENAANEASVLVKLQPNTIYTDIGTGGTGWVMMTRGVLERMQKECPGPWHWFARDPTAKGDDLRGEDVSFGLRLWGMKPRPKVVGSTHLLLRHLKTQPFIADFMSPVAASEKIPAMAMPNPYENDPEHFEVFGNTVRHKVPLTPEQVAALKEKQDALGRKEEVPNVPEGQGDNQEAQPAVLESKQEEAGGAGVAEPNKETAGS